MNEEILGARTAKGHIFTTLAPTTGGVTIMREGSDKWLKHKFPITPEGVDYESLTRDALEKIEGRRAWYDVKQRLLGKTNDSNTMNVEGQRLYLGNISINQSEITETWTKYSKLEMNP